MMLALLAVLSFACAANPPTGVTILGHDTVCEPYVLNVDLSTGQVINRTIPTGVCIPVVPIVLFQLDTCRRCFVMQYNLTNAYNLTVVNTCGATIVIESSYSVPMVPPYDYVWEDACFDGSHTAYIPVYDTGVVAFNLTSGAVLDKLSYSAIGMGPIMMDTARKLLYIVRTYAPWEPSDNCSPNCATLDILHYGPLRVNRVNIYLGRNGDLTSGFYAGQLGMFYDVHLKAVLTISTYDYIPVASLLNLTTLLTLPYDSFGSLVMPELITSGINNQLGYDAASGWAVFCTPGLHVPQICARYRPLSHSVEYTTVPTSDVVNFNGPPLLSFG